MSESLGNLHKAEKTVGWSIFVCPMTKERNDLEIFIFCTKITSMSLQ